MQLIKTARFVIESLMPVTKKEAFWQSGINSKYNPFGYYEGKRYVPSEFKTFHWYCGMSVLPGSNENPVPVDVWSPYFEDAQLFSEIDEAYDCLNRFTDKYSGAEVRNILVCHSNQSWVLV